MARKTVHVFDNLGSLIVFPSEIPLKGGVDSMQLKNDSTHTVLWIVPPGPFHPTTGVREQVAAGEVSSTKVARKVRLATPYQVVQIRRVKGLTKKRRGRARLDADPVIIIDT